MHEIWDRFSAFDPKRPNPSAGKLSGRHLVRGLRPRTLQLPIRRTPIHTPSGRESGLPTNQLQDSVARGRRRHLRPDRNYNYMGTTGGTGYNTLNINSTFLRRTRAATFATACSYDRNLLFSATAGSRNPPDGRARSIRPRPGRSQRRTPGADHQWSIGVQRRDHDEPGGGSQLRRQSRRMVPGELADRLMRSLPERLGSVRSGHQQRGRPHTCSPRRSVRRRRASAASTSCRTPASRLARPWRRVCGRSRSSATWHRWSPLGNNWYDSSAGEGHEAPLSHGLDVSAHSRGRRNWCAVRTIRAAAAETSTTFSTAPTRNTSPGNSSRSCWCRHSITDSAIRQATKLGAPGYRRLDPQRHLAICQRPADRGARFQHVAARLTSCSAARA